MIAIAAYIMLQQYENLLQLCGGCPAVCLYSQEPGTGKTFALHIASGLFGVEKVGI